MKPTVHTPQNPPTPPITPSPNSPPPTTPTNQSQPTTLLRSRPYLSQRQIEKLLPKDATQLRKERNLRLQSCSIIIQVGRQVQFPIRTLFTALLLYHRFKLYHPLYELNALNNRCDFSDAAIACLFLASKIEDTLQKSRELLAALHAARNPAMEPLSVDSPALQAGSERVLGLERILLECNCFDFRTRSPAALVVKVCRRLGLARESAFLAMEVLLDVYRTHAPLRCAPQGVALAAVMLAEKGMGRDVQVQDYSVYETSRTEVCVVMNELLDLWVEPDGETECGGRFSVERLVELRLEIQDAVGEGTNGVNGEGVEEIEVRPEGGSVRFILDADREREERRAIEDWDGTTPGG